MSGIDETKAIQEAAHRQRIDDAARLKDIRKEFDNYMAGHNAKESLPDKATGTNKYGGNIKI